MYNTEVIHIDKDDVIILHLTDNLDIESASRIIKDIQQAFPEQKVIATHPYVIENITIAKTIPENIYNQSPF